jgi:hypothetical protein
LGLAVAGCGGDSTAPKPVVESAPETSPAKTKPQVKTKGKGGSLDEGGDIGAAERRAAKQKERKAAGQ